MKVSVTGANWTRSIKKDYIEAAIWAGLAISILISGCSTQQLVSATAKLQSGAAIIASVNGAMPAACASVASIAGDVGSAIAKVGAANAGNAKVQAVVAKVNGGVAVSASDCALVSTLLAAY